MGTPDEPMNRKAIDASVGGLVWVRRRNGSWWPGRIVGLDELSESCLVSPRAGTPVKLLGREDASIDWYNLEKSKRVKAFRCGEYDRCIEKAKSFAANSGKKVVKYARREDAILHALEIESARLGKDHPDYFSRTENSDKSCVKDSPRISASGKENGEMTDETSESGNMLCSVTEVSHPHFSVKEPNHRSAKIQSVDQIKRRRTPNDSEDDGNEGIQRMRGLEDLGIGVCSKSKVLTGGMLDQVQQDNTMLYDLNAGKCLTLKRKRSQMGNTHESLKRKNRHRPLTKVLESTAMVSAPAACDEALCSGDFLLNGLSENHSDCTGVSLGTDCALLNNAANVGHGNIMENIAKDTEIISSVAGTTVVENASSDRLFHVPLIAEDKPPADLSSVLVSCSAEMPEAGGVEMKPSQANEAEAIPLKGEEHNECVPTTADLHAGEVSNRIEEGASMWQSKGKRNSRQTGKDRKGYSRKFFNIDGESDSCLAVMKQLDEYSPGCGEKTDRSRGCNNLQGSVAPPQLLTDAIRNHGSDHPLFDIEVDVEDSCRPQRVPLVSLVSKLNGKPIVGHPLTVEVLSQHHQIKVADGPAEANLPVSRSVGSRKGGKKRRRMRRYFSSHKTSKLKKCGMLSKKTRKLSSLTGHRQGEGNKKHVLEKAVNPVISCVPLKLVFGRLNEALNGPRQPKGGTLTTVGNS